MTVQDVSAFQISDGRCFGDKRTAYQEELVQLFQQLEVIKIKRYKLTEVDNMVKAVKDWLTKAEALRAQMRTEPDEEVAKDLAQRV